MGSTLQPCFRCGDDIANLKFLDQKHYMAISLPIASVRFDKRMLELLDSDKDGRIRVSEVLAAIDFLIAKGVDLNSLFVQSAEDKKNLDTVVARLADISKLPETPEYKTELAVWQTKLTQLESSILGDKTHSALVALVAVESLVDAYFVPTEDMPLVMEEPDRELPLNNRLNPIYRESLLELRDKCVKGVLGDVESLDTLSWQRLKAIFEPYREHLAAKPIANADAKVPLEEQEKILRFKIGLLEFLENFVNMKRLYCEKSWAIYQTGVLRIDARELELCFDVENETAHSALTGKSNCCVLYLKLTRPATKATRHICAVVTAGSIARLYVGRNGVFHDRDGNEWEAVITKVVENQVSLEEAFWLPWKKLGDSVTAMVKKFFGEKQSSGQKSIDGSVRSAEASGAALASSVAAIGIGIGMIGAAAASIVAAVSGMDPWTFTYSFAALLFIVSMPSVVLAWFKLRRRDIGAILNACGWAVNRPMIFSTKRAHKFTKCAYYPGRAKKFLIFVFIIGLLVGGHYAYKGMRKFICSYGKADKVETTQANVKAN